MTSRIGLVTSETVPDLSDDGKLLQEKLRDSGLTAEPVVWTDQKVDGSSFDIALLRSCWDYHTQPEAFEKWVSTAADAGVTILNPLSIVQWNMHKFYLRDLAERGVQIPETVWIESGDDTTLSAALEGRDWEKAVVKPAVGTSSAGLWRTSLAEVDANEERFESMKSDGDVLIQRFLPEVSEGERSIVFFAGEYSHTFNCVPAESDFRAHPNYGGQVEQYDPPQDVIDQAKSILEDAGEILGYDVEQFVYARVDGVERDGEFCLMELELIEPFLNLSIGSDTPERFVSAIESAIE